MTEEEKITANAQLTIDKLGPISGLGPQFGYNRESVKWVEGYIERCRKTADVAQEDVTPVVQVLGSYFGECIIHSYGGAWRERDGTWGVFFDDKNAVFPFYSVGKQFKGGLEDGDSILGVFDLIGPLMLKKPQEPPEGL